MVKCRVLRFKSMDSLVGEGISYEAWFNLLLVLKPIDVSNGSLPRFIRGQSRPWSDGYLFSVFNASQQLSIRFNNLQHDSTTERLTALNSYPQLPSEPPLKGGRRAASGGSRTALSEA